MTFDKSNNKNRTGQPAEQSGAARGANAASVCPVCRGSTLIEIRGKLQCGRCHAICETCCEGGRG